MDFALLFRLLGLFLGLALGLLSYRIFVFTRGASDGWKYITAAGMLLFLWAVGQLFYKVLGLPDVFKEALGFICFSVISIAVVASFASFLKDFGYKSGFFTMRNMLILYGVYWAVFLVLNFLVFSYTSVIRELAGIAHFSLTVVVGIGGIYPAYRLWKGSKKWMWLQIFLFALLVPIGVLLGAYTSGCCEQPLAVCQGLNLDYAEILPVACIPAILALSKYYHALILLGLIFVTLGFYGFWRKLR